MAAEPILRVKFSVVGYDSGGYGDDRSRNDFTNGEDAVAYAASLPANFRAVAWKTISMDPIHTKLYDAVDPPIHVKIYDAADRPK